MIFTGSLSHRHALVTRSRPNIPAADRIFAGHAEQVFEVADVELGGLRLLRDNLAQGVERVAMNTRSSDS